jgi:outer membrane protein
MKKSLILILTILTLSIFVYSEVKIGIINAQEIMAKTQKGIQVQKKLESLQKKKQGELQVKQDELKRLEKELSSPALNADTRARKTRDLQDKRIQMQRLVEDAEKLMRSETQKELTGLQREIMPLIQEIGKSKGFSVIFDVSSSGIAYFSSTIDITADVIKAVDAKFPGK